MMDGIHEPSLEYIASAYDQSIHLGRLVEDLRTLTLAESGHLPLEVELIDPRALLEGAAQRFQPLAEDAGIALSTDLPSELPKVEMDKDRIQQVLANLLANALRHTPNGGTITIGGGREGDMLRIRVANSGITLTGKEAEHVFDRFWRGDGSRGRDTGGSGLGLSIARQFIQLHGGCIWVELSGEGTQFIFEIPLTI
jgi:signal transduction histidine kinase